MEVQKKDIIINEEFVLQIWPLALIKRWERGIWDGLIMWKWEQSMH